MLISSSSHSRHFDSLVLQVVLTCIVYTKAFPDNMNSLHTVAAGQFVYTFLSRLFRMPLFLSLVDYTFFVRKFFVTSTKTFFAFS